ncbi:MAG TPA: hypothetical protein VMW02_01920 [Thermoplasmata archaeon]|nr:hypothetical protein [Thermoplasmata archaeon]
MIWDANVCPYCGKDYRQPAPGMMPAAPPKQKSALPIVGGILLIASSIIGILMAVGLMIIATQVGGVFSLLPIDLTDMMGTAVGDMVQTILMIMAVAGLIISILVLLGGYFAAVRRHFGMAMVGAVFGLLVLSPYFIASIMSLVGLILIAVSHHEFN